MASDEEMIKAAEAVGVKPNYDQTRVHVAYYSCNEAQLIAFARRIEAETLDRAAAICDVTFVQPGDMQVESCHEAAAAIRALKRL